MWFFDESRFGTPSNIGHAWYPKGERTAIDTKLGYKNFYLYAAINAKTGEDFSLIFPKVNTCCMNVFLEPFKQEHQDKKIAMVMDGAAWHKSKELLGPDKLRIIIQPPYSPELNPVEKFWQYIKSKTIKNKIFDNLQQLQDAIRTFFAALSAES